MAASSASRSWAAFARRAAVTGTVAAAGLIALAIPASAHTSDAKALCGGEGNKVALVHVNAKSFVPSKDGDDAPNTVTIIEVLKGGEKKTLHEVKFGAMLPADKSDFTVGDSTVEHSIVVQIVAADDKKFNNTIKLNTKICDKKETPPSSNPPSNPPSSPAPAPQPAPAPPAVGAAGELASTGASIGLPLAIGALLLVGGGVLLLVMRKRGKA